MLSGDIESWNPNTTTILLLLANIAIAAFAAATGSGKTLAYLLPLMQRLKNDELLMSEEQMQARKVKRPRALIMAPTRGEK